MNAQHFEDAGRQRLQYGTAPKAGKFVLIAHGFVYDTTHFKEILNLNKPEKSEHHQ